MIGDCVIMLLTDFSASTSRLFPGCSQKTVITDRNVRTGIKTNFMGPEGSSWWVEKPLNVETQRLSEGSERGS